MVYNCFLNSMFITMKQEASTILEEYWQGFEVGALRVSCLWYHQHSWTTFNKMSLPCWWCSFLHSSLAGTSEIGFCYLVSNFSVVQGNSKYTSNLEPLCRSLWRSSLTVFLQLCKQNWWWLFCCAIICLGDLCSFSICLPFQPC